MCCTVVIEIYLSSSELRSELMLFLPDIVIVEPSDFALGRFDNEDPPYLDREDQPRTVQPAN